MRIGDGKKARVSATADLLALPKLTALEPISPPPGAGDLRPTPTAIRGGRLHDVRVGELVPPYGPRDRYLWDSWIMVDGPIFRLFHLDAPMHGGPDARHDQARIRGATSTDLINWTDIGPVLESALPGSWDDSAIWTGNTYRDGDELLLFYTARNERDGQTQRIGLATSKDGINFERGAAPLLEADPRWYETDEPSPIYRAFRDPCVVHDAANDRYLMYVTAKTKGGDPKYRGCVGLAVADNLRGPYQALPPVLAPGSFAQMEVPQIIQKDGRTYLFVSAADTDLSPALAAKLGGARTGLFGFVADDLTGPFVPLPNHGLVAGSDHDLYSVKLMEDPSSPGDYTAFGWYREDTATPFRLAAPRAVRWDGDSISIAKQ